MSIYSKISPSQTTAKLNELRGYLGLSLSNRITGSIPQLHELLSWAKDHLRSVCVLVGDYVYRHNLEDLQGLQRDVALALAKTEGVAIAMRVRKVLDELDLKNSTIVLASELYELPTFNHRLMVKNALYDSNAEFRELINIASNGFFERFAKDRMHIESARRHSRDYQLEELALFELLAEQGYTVNVYPGAHLPVMKDIVAGKFPGVMPLLERLTLVELRFRSTP